MRRLLGFLLRNWPLKLGAVVLATLLYSGLVLSQNVRTFAGPVPIEPIRQPPGAALLNELPVVTQVRYRAPLDVIVSPETFRATADLSRIEARPGGQPVSVPVTVVALDRGVEVVGHEPNLIQVHLDPVQSRTMTVQDDKGTVPDGLTLGPAQIEPQSVTVRGPSSRVAAIRSVIARVSIDASALNVDREVDLTAVDEQGNVVTNVDIEPPRARVRIAVAEQLANRTLPVVPQFTGALPNGLRLDEIEVDPPTVSVSGDEALIVLLDSAPTQPIELVGRTRDFEVDVPLDLPEGVTVTGPPQVRVLASLVEDAATRNFQVGLRLLGADPALEYELGSTHILVLLGGTMSELDTVNPALLVANLDVGALEPGSNLVAVTFTPPPGLELLSIAPSQVTVVVNDLLPQPTKQPTDQPTDSPDPSPSGGGLAWPRQI